MISAATISLLVLLHPSTRCIATAARDTYEQLEAFASIISIVQKHYVEEVDTENLVTGAINGMISSLDPHSAYLTPELYKELQIDTRGSFGGLGIEITMKDDVLTIIAPLEDTPAWREGIKPGDRIVKIDGQLTKGMSLMKAVSLMRGLKGTQVTLSIGREGEPQLLDMTITREVIKIKSVKGARLYSGRYGYVRLAQFQENSAQELAAALEKLEKDSDGGLEGLVLDLRNNPGGLLDQAVQVADLFLDAGLIVYTDGRIETQNQRFYADADGTVANFPVVVLVNNGSASASEIVAGALQDHHRAVVLGTTTFGKGSVQTILPLDGQSALRLTTARYYTPSGRSIQATGITPDVVVEPAMVLANAASSSLSVREADLVGHMENGTDQAARSEEDASEDVQLQRGLDLLKTWRVFSKVAHFSAPTGEFPEQP